MCHGQKSRFFLGVSLIPPLMTEILISWGPINPYVIGLMSLSSITWKCHEMLIDPIAQMMINLYIEVQGPNSREYSRIPRQQNNRNPIFFIFLATVSEDI